MSDQINTTKSESSQSGNRQSDLLDFVTSPLSIIRSLTEINSIAELFAFIEDSIAPEFNIALFTIYRYQEERDLLINVFQNECKQASKVTLFKSSVFGDIHFEGISTNSSLEKTLPGDSILTGDYIDNFLEEPIMKYAYRKDGIRLRIGDKLIGIAVLLFEKENALDQEKIDLIQLLFNQVAHALNRLDISYMIHKQQHERELLLSLSTAIAKVKDQSQLQKILSAHLKDFIGFSHIAIALYDQQKNLYNLFMLDPYSKSRHHPDYKALKSQSFELDDFFTKAISSSPFPISFDLEGIETEKIPLYLRVNKESGIKQLVGIRLNNEDKPLGILAFFFEHKVVLSNDLRSILVSTGHQISVAVSNIVSEQEVNRLLTLKSTLLSFGVELRVTKNIEELSKIIKKQIFELFKVNEFLITVFSEDLSSQEVFFYDHSNVLAQDKRFKEFRAEPIARDSELYKELLQNPYLVRFPKKTADTDFLTAFLTPRSDESIVGSVITLGNRPVGTIIFSCTDPRKLGAERQVFESFCSQIGFVILNILAHRGLEEKLKETNRFVEKLEVERTYLAQEINIAHNPSEIVGTCEPMEKVFQLVSQVAKSSSTVLILGETGTGKELIARAIHNNSMRSNKLMIKVNCAAIPSTLIESELFGHEKGSFTGATERRIGKFELAHGGTLFLDEVGEMPIDLQVKLLRALQEKEIERVGGKGTINVDVRIVAATNRNLEEEMVAGRFRRDLFYRLNIFPIKLPPLRERKEDIESLTIHFLEKHGKRCGINDLCISPKAVQDLKRYSWPGNIRELEHLIERSILLSNSNIIRNIVLPEQIATPIDNHESEEKQTLRTIDENERDHILRVLKYCSGRIAGSGNAADILGVPPTTLNSKMKRLGIKRAHST